MDYSLYFWHVLTHRVPVLWRFHLPHHVDLDMDASTALRFHAGEMLFSVPFRAAQVLLLGASVRAYSCWQTATFVPILFHHSNLNLPRRIDDALALVVVTPRLHGIHHDAVRSHTNSNWSSGLSIWDRLHGTYRRDVDQAEVVVGVPAYQSPHDVTLPKLLQMPFAQQRKDWEPVATN
jgi:sterol desaturase/sphingolipid hydroxylase (fatty acid hydroxylase superfamily)